jgi:hypothetical protein
MTEPLLSDEMLERLEAGEDPVDLSIEKYERLLEIVNNGGKIYEGLIMSGCCPLCHEYYCNIDEDEIDDECNEYLATLSQCPLEIYEDYCCDIKSTWESVRYSVEHGEPEDIINAVKNMITKLKWIKERMVEDD